MIETHPVKKLNNYAPGDSRAFYAPWETEFAEPIAESKKCGSPAKKEVAKRIVRLMLSRFRRGPQPRPLTLAYRRRRIEDLST